ncbi:MAG TPA: cytochrome P450 [Acidimicrobiia bacterium]|nr:cytochrome P450 [Acidimicrobiia bacterium]
MAISAQELDLPTCDLTDLDRQSRFAVLADARDRHWLARSPMGYVVTRYSDTVAVLRERRFHSALSLIPQMQGIETTAMEERRPSILSMEGDEHARLRRLVAPAFTPAAADRLRPFMRRVVDELVDAVQPSGHCDFVSGVCEPYPIPIICELLGAPKEDWQLFLRWATDIFRLFNQNLAEDLPAIQRASAELEEYVHALVDRRRAQPADDLLGALIAVEEQGDRLATDELVMLAEAVLMAGTDTTRNQLACCIALLTTYPDQWRRFVAAPDLAPRVVEETMRYLGAVQGTIRVASEDIEYRDVVFPKGSLVSVSLSGANRDPEVYEEPDTFDITREPSTPHMTFGSGIHHCLGAHLARAELGEALTVIAGRMPDLASDGPVEWKSEKFGIWGPARLPVRWSG